jgi:hypothetical protein
MGKCCQMVKMVYDGRSVSDSVRWCMMVEVCQMVVRWCMMVKVCQMGYTYSHEAEISCTNFPVHVCYRPNCYNL